jgi:hypothetical protein
MLAAALRQAAHEDRLDVAEHIVRALEILDARQSATGNR